ncbi:MAG: class I SAM-dependent RNA methyltransferase [Synergistales bacterium]|nr:class I SAM-dependent RNA methyltransferase [Synergistales bacterium]
MIREDTILPAGCSPECGGCADGWCTEESSISRKQSRAARALTRWEDRLGALLSVSGEKRFGYRGRTALSARWTPGEGWRFGMEGVRAQGAIKMRFLRPRPFVSLLGCPVHSPGVRRMLNLLAASLPPDEPEGSFPLAFVSISGAQCTLIFKVKEDPGDEWFFSSRGGMPPLSETMPAAGAEGIWIHLHPAAGVRLFAKGGWRLAWGKPRSADCRGLLYGPASFSQLIPELHGHSLNTAGEYLRPCPGDAVLDLYCGTGASMALWAAAGAAVMGIEAGGEAVDCARLNIPEAEVLRGTCADRLPQAEKFLLSVPRRRRMVYANPPRVGLEPPVREALAERLCPARLAYLSCSPGTLARDLAVLEKGGFTVERLIPYDFFPRTAAVEVLALLEGPEG